MKSPVKTRESRAETKVTEKRRGPGLATSRMTLFQESESSRQRRQKADDPMMARLLPERLHLDFASDLIDLSSVSTPLLLEQAIAGQASELPQRQVLEKGFGFSLAGIRVDRNPAASALLDRLRAEAAVYRGHILLGEAAPSLFTLAHEVVHILQSDSTTAEVRPDFTLATEKAEIEAESLAHRVESRVSGHASHIPLSPLVTESALGEGVVALRSSGRIKPLAAAPDLIGVPSASTRRAAEPESQQPEKQEETNREPESGTIRSEVEAVVAPDSALNEAENSPSRKLQSESEIGVTNEPNPRGNEQLAGAQIRLSSAEDSSALMDAFVAAPPTLKAQMSGKLGDQFSGTMSRETKDIQDNTPAVEVQMRGNTPAAAVAITSPDLTAIELEPTPPGPAPDARSIVGEAVQNESQASRNGGILEQLSSSQLNPVNLQRTRIQLQSQSLDNIQTTDPNIVTSPGVPPKIPLQGETGSRRFQNQVDEGTRYGRETLAEQKEQALALPGAERVQLADVHESLPLGELAAHTADLTAAPEGAERYLQLGLPAEIQTAFDGIAGDSMQQSQIQAQTQVRQAVKERDESYRIEVEKARNDTSEAQHTADMAQRNNVAEAQDKIDDSRHKTLQDQETAVHKMEADANLKRDAERQEYDRLVNEKQQEIDGEYAAAEEKATAKVRQGEEQAEAERLRKEREAKDQNWWEAALSFITELFDALVSFINDVFNAVRSYINNVFNALRNLVISLIEAIAGALKRLINGFGEILKGLVQRLLRDQFPQLAAALTKAIDRAVTAANSAINAVADKLKSTVNSIVDTLHAGINAVLDAYQNSINAALSLAGVALSGDWGSFFLKLFEATCLVAGIDPESFYAFIGRARETIDLIINNPGEFISNIFNAVIGGFRLFGTNFLTHLQRGVIEWLTGALGSAGITLPERFDLMGVIGLVAQILGLTWDNLRQRIVRVVGERGAQVFDFVAKYVETLIDGGWSALWERIQSDLASLRDRVLDQLKHFIVENIITAGLTRISLMFNPVGALLNLIIAAYNFYTFIRDQMERIARVVSVVTEMIGNIARGVLGPAMQSIESVLAGLLTLALDLLARLLGLGNVGGRVREILQGVQASIWGAIDRLIDSVISMFRGGGADASAKKAAASGATADIEIGTDITITVPDEEPHHLFFQVRGQDAVLIIRSDPRPVTDLLSNWEQSLNTLEASRQSEASSLMSQVRALIQETDQEADILAAARFRAPQTTPAQPTRNSEMKEPKLSLDERQREIAELLRQLFPLFVSDDRKVAIRFELALSNKNLQGEFSRSDWQNEFKLGERLAQSDLKWGIDNNKLDYAAAGKKRLKLSDDDLVPLAARVISVRGRISDTLGNGRPFFLIKDVQQFCIAAERLPNDTARYSDPIVRRIVQLLQQRQEITEDSQTPGQFIFAEIPEKRGIPANWDSDKYRRHFYLNRSNFNSEKQKIIDVQFPKIEEAVDNLSSKNKEKIEKGQEVWADLVKHEAVYKNQEFEDYNPAELKKISNWHVDHTKPLALHWQTGAGEGDAGNNTSEEKRLNIGGGAKNLRIMWGPKNSAEQARGGKYVEYVLRGFTSEVTEKKESPAYVDVGVKFVQYRLPGG